MSSTHKTKARSNDKWPLNGFEQKKECLENVWWQSGFLRDSVMSSWATVL